MPRSRANPLLLPGLAPASLTRALVSSYQIWLWLPLVFAMCPSADSRPVVPLLPPEHAVSSTRPDTAATAGQRSPREGTARLYRTPAYRDRTPAWAGCASAHTRSCCARGSIYATLML